MTKVKQLEKYKHPNSRKTKALAKQLKKQSTREKSKLSSNIKQNLLGEKFLWFRDNLKPDKECCVPDDVEKLIFSYLDRFNDELEQIKIKHSIGQRKNRQHASREDIINLTLKQEKEEFQTAGIELPDLLNSVQFSLLKNWTGELRFMQNFKLRRFSIQSLKIEKDKLKKKRENEMEKKEKSGEENIQKSEQIMNTKTQHNEDKIFEDGNKSSVNTMEVDR